MGAEVENCDEEEGPPLLKPFCCCCCCIVLIRLPIDVDDSWPPASDSGPIVDLPELFCGATIFKLIVIYPSHNKNI